MNTDKNLLSFSVFSFHQKLYRKWNKFDMALLQQCNLHRKYQISNMITRVWNYIFCNFWLLLSIFEVFAASDVVQKYQNTVATKRFKNHVLFFYNFSCSILVIWLFFHFHPFFIKHWGSVCMFQWLLSHICFFFLIFAISSIFIHPKADLYEGFCCLFLHQKGHFDLIKICWLVSPSVSQSVWWLVCCSVGQSISWSIGHSMPLMFIS